ncbi:MAG: transcription elongation factor GreA [Eubacteriaceae bacterium]|jgi:transcription elongation factor GreA|nr:transcription elongation factor GreA [Eubacteriaceae bacterium]
MAEELLLTKEGYEKIKAEHEELVSVTRAEVAEKLKEARAFGDLSENAEYDAAKDEQAEVEARILKLENMMREAKIIDAATAKRDRVNVGTKVTIKNVKTNEEFTYAIVGATEADPFEGKISNDSAVGGGLLGHKTGDVVEIEIPDGSVTYEIIKIAKR